MTPDAIRSHGRVIRNKIARLGDQYGKMHPAVGLIISHADDLCELVIALAENQIEWTQEQQAQKGDPDA